MAAQIALAAATGSAAQALDAKARIFLFDATGKSQQLPKRLDMYGSVLAQHQLQDAPRIEDFPVPGGGFIVVLHSAPKPGPH
jgi:hypothetical protein